MPQEPKLTIKDDTLALVRVIAYAATSDLEEAERLVEWAYGNVIEETETESESAETEKETEEQREKREYIDYQSVLFLWNASAKGNVPKVRDLSKARKEKIRMRVKEMGGWDKAKDMIRECIRKINESDFCTGASGRWVATFDWLFSNGTNWTKVLEGNYDNRKAKTSIDILKENIEKADAHYEQRYRYGGPSAYGVPSGSGEDGADEQ